MPTFHMVLSEIRPRVAKGVLPKISVRTKLRLIDLDFGGVYRAIKTDDDAGSCQDKAFYFIHKQIKLGLRKRT